MTRINSWDIPKTLRHICAASLGVAVGAVEYMQNVILTILFSILFLLSGGKFLEWFITR